MIYNFLSEYLSIIIFLFIALFLSIGFIVANYLASPSLQNFNFIKAVEVYCAKVSVTSYTKFKFNSLGEKVVLNKTYQTTIYKVIKELIINIVKHSKQFHTHS